MATPKETVWARDPHTAAKHQMLNGYLAAWFPIMAAQFKDKGITYVDAFAGPGEYTKGELGSPLLALVQAARTDVTKYGCPIRLLFIEERKDRLDNLRRIVDRRFPVPSRPVGWVVSAVQGRCQDKLIAALSQVGATSAPVLANFDGWGVDTPMSLVRHLGRYQSAEVIITFGPQWLVRFAGREDLATGNLVFGDEGWRPLASNGAPSEKKRRLVDYYRSKLTEAHFSYSLVFEMLDEGGHDLLLVYATSSLRGLEKMKEAMWAVDPVYGQHFRDPRDLSQLSFELDTKADIRVLKRQLLERLERGAAPLEVLKEYALKETIFKKTHAPLAVEELERDRLVVCKHARSHSDYIVELAPPTLFG